MSVPAYRNYSRPVSLGGEPSASAQDVVLRWFGTACFELSFGDRVLLLDNYYDRTSRDHGLGFAASDVSRADLILIGHPHADHVGDTVQVARQTGARAMIAPIGADFLLAEGLPADQILPAPGLGDGDVVEGDGFSVRALHGYHLDIGLTPEQVARWDALREARMSFEADFFPPISAAEDEASSNFSTRGVHTPEVITEATLTYIIEIDGFRIAYRDSGGAISEEERAFVAANPDIDLAILSLNGLPHVEAQLEDVFLPLVDLYRPKLLVPAHHDGLWANTGTGLRRLFSDVSSELIKSRVHDEHPGIVTAQPAYLEPLSVDRGTGAAVLGELSLR